MKNEILKRILSSIAILPIALYFIIKGSFFFSFFLIIFFLATSYEWANINKKLTIKFFGIIFLLLTSYFAYLLREDVLGGGLYLFLFVIIICIFTDIGGYVFGKLFKGPKLTKISPNKTYSGMTGSYLLSVIGANLFLKTLTLEKLTTLFEMQFFYMYGAEVGFKDLKLLLIILFISTISQMGDLFISYFKRLSKVKNTGKILPGHGGLLDRVDGIIFAIPASYILFQVLV